MMNKKYVRNKGLGFQELVRKYPYFVYLLYESPNELSEASGNFPSLLQ